MKSWRDIPVEHWFDYADLYDTLVERLTDGARIVEVGSWLGRSTCYLGQRIKQSGKRIEAIAVDNCRGTNKDEYMRQTIETAGGNIAGVLLQNLIDCEVVDVVKLIVANSVDAARLFEDKSLDCVFIDADHEYQSIKSDLAAWHGKVKSGGMFSGHDYTGHGWDDVKRAVDELYQWNTYLLDDPPLSKCCWSAISL